MPKQRRRLTGLFLICSLQAQALVIAPINGGIAAVTLPDSDSRPQVSYLGHRVLVSGHAPHWRAIVGIPLDRPAGVEHLEESSPIVQSVAFTIEHKAYPEQHITLSNQHMVDPTPTQLLRIHRELKEETADFALFDGQEPSLSIDHLPVTATALDSAFGLRRFFNGEERAPHSGLDLKAQEGQMVTTPLPGRVVLGRELYFNGGTVIIDHGRGLVSMYCHLSRIEVQPGQILHAGEELGRAGHSGRATGPHLHWSMSLNDVRIDPALLLSDELRHQLGLDH